MKLRRRTVPRLGIDAAFTAGFNMMSTLVAGLGGIILARELGVAGRGDYATIISWMGAALVVGELGQTASVTYFASRRPEQAPSVVATAGSIMRRTGLVAIAITLVAAFQSPTGSERWWSYALLALVLPVSFVTAPYVFVLQASNIVLWNKVTAMQPVLWLLGLTLILPFARLTVPLAMTTILVTVAAQGLFAWRLAHIRGIAGGRTSPRLRREMLTYGSSNMVSALPTALARQLDVIVLGTLATSYSVGLYSVAVSYSQLTFPLASAIGSVVFPHQARSDGAGQALVGRSLRWTVAVTLLGMTPLVGLATWLLPTVYGSGFRESAHVLLILIPGMLALAIAQVSGDLLRDMGRPRAVAKAGWSALAVLLGGLLVLAPSMHQYGAAIAYSAAQTTAAAILLIVLASSNSEAKRQTRDRPQGPSQESGDLPPSLPTS